MSCFLLAETSAVLQEICFDILEQIISRENISDLNVVINIFVWLSIFQFNSKGRIGYLSLCFYLIIVQWNTFEIIWKYFHGFLHTYNFFYSTTFSENITKISSWDYIIKFRKLKVLITTQFFSENLILCVHTFLL